MEPNTVDVPPQILIDQLYAQLSKAIADNIVLQSKLTYLTQVKADLEQQIADANSSSEDETL